MNKELEIKYENKIVAYLDILGFKELVLNETNSSVFINKYFSIITCDFDSVIRDKSKSLSYMLLSDSIIISVDYDVNSFVILIKTIAKLQTKLLEEGLVIRGSISYGALYMNPTKNILVGEGLIKAYFLEQKSLYPRIIIDRALCQNFYNTLYNFQKSLGDYISINSHLPYINDYPFINLGKSIILINQRNKLDKIKAVLIRNFYKNEESKYYIWIVNNILQNAETFLNVQEAKNIINRNKRYKYKHLSQFIDELKKL